MGGKKYKTKQRDEILRFFEENQGECFSAREVAKKVEAGEATVFRTITFNFIKKPLSVNPVSL